VITHQYPQITLLTHLCQEKFYTFLHFYKRKIFNELKINNDIFEKKDFGNKVLNEMVLDMEFFRKRI